MENFEVTVNGQDYKIVQHEELKSLFIVTHSSGTQRLAQNQTTGEWRFLEHSMGTHPIDLDTFSKIIEERL